MFESPARRLHVASDPRSIPAARGPGARRTFAIFAPAGADLARPHRPGSCNQAGVQHVAPPHEGTLRACRLFAALDPAVVRDLASAARRSRLLRGEPLWLAGSPAIDFVVVAAGLVCVRKPCGEGESCILGIFGPKECIGTVAVLAQTPYPADAIVITDHADVLRIDASVVRDIAERDASVVRALNTALIEHTRVLEEKIRILAAGRVDQRLATLLLHLASRFGDELEDGTTFIPVQLSRAECARLVGSTVETTIRTFTRWQRAGLVDTTADGFAVPSLAAVSEVARA